MGSGELGSGVDRVGGVGGVDRVVGVVGVNRVGGVGSSTQFFFSSENTYSAGWHLCSQMFTATIAHPLSPAPGEAGLNAAPRTPHRNPLSLL